jgi:hypothetical protein
MEEHNRMEEGERAERGSLLPDLACGLRPATNICLQLHKQIAGSSSELSHYGSQLMEVAP